MRPNDQTIADTRRPGLCLRLGTMHANRPHVMCSAVNRWALLLALGAASGPALGIDGGQRYINPRNGWAAFEVITQGDDVPADGQAWAMPGSFDGLGAQGVSDSTLRVQVNHEISGGGATISEVLLDLPALQSAITNTIKTENTGGVSFVVSARQAYNRWTSDGGSSWTATSAPRNTSFSRFCSGQSYAPNTFGQGRGLVDDVYITGEESGTDGRLFALDIANGDFYQVSGYTGGAAGRGGGIAGMPTDSWENAALIDTDEIDHIALLLSPDGGTQNMKLYIGEKGKDRDGDPSGDFLARNGLAYGSFYFLNGSLPDSLGSTFTAGFFDDTSSGALNSSKLEDVDTSPGSRDKVVLGDQDSGVFVFNFDLVFLDGSFDTAASGFSVTKIANDGSGQSLFGDADNVDWTAPTTLGGSEYPDGLLLVNEDNDDGQVWIMEPDGSNQVLIGDTVGNAGTESSGVLDVSDLLGYLPGSIILTDNQGSPSSLTVLINPDAARGLCPADINADGVVDVADLLGLISVWGDCRGCDGDVNVDGTVDVRDLIALFAAWGACG